MRHFVKRTALRALIGFSALLTGLGYAGTTAHADTSPVVFSGVVADGQGNPVSGVQVALKGANGNCVGAPLVSGTSASDGSFSVTVGPGSYALSLTYGGGPSMPEFNLCVPSISLTTSLTQNITLPAHSLTVTVQDSNGAPVPGASVQYGTVLPVSFDLFPGASLQLGTSAQFLATTVTDANGVAVIPLLPMSNAVNLPVVPPTGSTLSATTISTGLMQNNTAVTATLANPVVFSGAVQDGQGNPVSGVQVALKGANGNCVGAPLVSGTSASDGSFSVTVGPGSYALSLTYNGGPSMPEFNLCVPSVSLRANLVQNITLPVHTLTVTVLDSSGAPVPGASVQYGTVLPVSFDLFPGASLQLGTSAQFLAASTTNANGIAVIPLLPMSNAVNLPVLPPTGSTLSATTISTGLMQNNTAVTATLATPVVFSGIVQDGQGNTVSGVQVALKGANGNCVGAPLVSGTSASDGLFSVTVGPGSYALSLTYNGGPSMPEFNLCVPSVSLTTSLTQNITLPMHSLTVTAVDSSGTPVPGASVQYGTVLPVSFDVFPGASLQLGTSAQFLATSTTNANGIAVIPLLPMSNAVNLPVLPPTGSTLSATTISTGLMQNNTAVTAILPGTVQAATTTALVSSVNPSVAGQQVAFTATVSGGGASSGAVTFAIDGVDQPSVTLNSGTATLSATTLSVGTHMLTATYSGDTYHAASTSATLTQVVNQAATTTTLLTSANPSQVGQPGTVTATVTPAAPGTGTPTGNVTFTIDGTTQSPVALASGSASLDLSTLDPGTHTITASYSGDSDYVASTSASLTQTIAQATATIALTSSANPAVAGQAVTFTANVSPNSPAMGAPTGTVTFTVDGTAEPAVTLASGSATLAVASLPVGSHSIAAAYSGDTDFAAAVSDALTQTVNQAATTTSLSSSADPSANGHPVTVTATVTATAPGAGTPTGSMVFTIDGAPQNPVPLSAGSTSMTLSTLAPGTHTITAAYSGDSNFTASTSSTLTQTVTPPTATSINMTTTPTGTAVQGTPVTLTATENPATAGTVQFLDNGSALSSPVPVSGGTATLTTTTLPVGAHSLTADFTPSDPAYSASTSSSVNLQITPVGIAIDQTITKSGTGTVTTAPFTTTGPRLLVAFTSSDGPATRQTTIVTGAGLTWTLAQRANAKGGTAEIWTAYATGPLIGATVTSTPKTSGYAQLLTVEAFTGASGVGAGTIAGKTGGTPTTTVTTTTANSWIFGVGEDYTRATTITPGTGQTLLQQTQDTVNGDTFWVQNHTATTPTTGTKVTVNDTAPTGDTWNLAAIEITPAS